MGVASPSPGESLMDLFPELAAEWHPVKNGDLVPSQVKPYSTKKVWWRCARSPDHEWEAVVGNRSQGRGCPFCGGKQVLVGFNDLATVRPDLAAEWHPTLNGTLTPSDVTVGAGTRVWWRCPVGPDHEWQTTVAARSSYVRGRGCAICAGRKVVPSTCLESLFPDVAVEWHPMKNGELTPANVSPFVTKRVWWRCAQGHEWTAQIQSRTRQGTGCPQCAGRVAIPGETDLATLHPAIAAEWHPLKNDGLRPNDVRPGSNRSVWWQCTEGHEWRTSVVNRVGLLSSCPYCAGQRAIPGINDLATTHPDVAAEWHPTKNGELLPRDVMGGTSRLIWWCCSLGHDWPAPPYNRVGLNSGCPVCANKTVLPGFNDLETTNPSLAGEWHPTKNKGVSPSDVTAGSGKKYWWRCVEGHEWSSTVANRSWGQGCPTCAQTGFNPGREGWLYFLQHPEWDMYQVGISNVIEDRLARHQKSGWEIIEVRGPLPGDHIARLERAALKVLRSRGADLGKRGRTGGFDGYTESWPRKSLEVSSIRELLGWIHELTD
ncbi:MAG: hypothetical protein FGM45_02575 [Actinobacteria bacterium]|nr:hypothetical protein [Actinomycetota bacterium]